MHYNGSRLFGNFILSIVIKAGIKNTDTANLKKYTANIYLNIKYIYILDFT